MANLRRIRTLRLESGGDDAETLARMFEDPAIADDGTLHGRLDALLDATAHRWLPGIHTWFDVPGLFELAGFGDRGFRTELRDPWPVSREQIGHLLTALGMALYPGRLEDRRFGRRVRDLAGAPRDMAIDEVALRLAIGHEKAPDPRAREPLVLVKVRRQYAASTFADVVAFRTALASLGAAVDLRLDAAREHLAAIPVGSGPGNSLQDLLLTLVAFRLAQLIELGLLADGREVAAWVRHNLRQSGAAPPTDRGRSGRGA